MEMGICAGIWAEAGRWPYTWENGKGGERGEMSGEMRGEWLGAPGSGEGGEGRGEERERAALNDGLR